MTSCECPQPYPARPRKTGASLPAPTRHTTRAHISWSTMRVVWTRAGSKRGLTTLRQQAPTAEFIGKARFSIASVECVFGERVPPQASAFSLADCSEVTSPGSTRSRVLGAVEPVGFRRQRVRDLSRMSQLVLGFLAPLETQGDYNCKPIYLKYRE